MGYAATVTILPQINRVAPLQSHFIPIERWTPPLPQMVLTPHARAKATIADHERWCPWAPSRLHLPPTRDSGKNRFAEDNLPLSALPLLSAPPCRDQQPHRPPDCFHQCHQFPHPARPHRNQEIAG